MSRRKHIVRGARPDPTKAAVALSWIVKVTEDGEIQVTNIVTIPKSNPSGWKVADICIQNKIKFVPGRYFLCFSLDEGMLTPVLPKGLDSGSRLKLVTVFSPILAITSARLSEELARFPSDDEIREGVEKVVASIFDHLLQLDGDSGKIPTEIYSNIRPGFISVEGVECVQCMGLRGQQIPVGEVLHKFLAVYDSAGVEFGNGMSKIEFHTGKCVVKVGYRYLSHDFIFAHSVNIMLAKRFAKILAEVEHDIMAHHSKDLHSFCVTAMKVLDKIAGSYGFAFEEPAQAAGPVPTLTVAESAK
ncbi:hypothetical protein HYV69_02450 [Candidatus Uhrbacteria bacterium]|nr:hypothetical protein [Candidatus Uhrbacteria bacterium]